MEKCYRQAQENQRNRLTVGQCRCLAHLENLIRYYIVRKDGRDTIYCSESKRNVEPLELASTLTARNEGLRVFVRDDVRRDLHRFDNMDIYHQIQFEQAAFPKLNSDPEKGHCLVLDLVPGISIYEWEMKGIFRDPEQQGGKARGWGAGAGGFEMYDLGII